MKAYLFVLGFLGFIPLAYAQQSLRIAPNATVTLPDSVIDLDSLVMGNRARLKLSAPKVTLLVSHLFVEGRAIIDGRGETGKDGEAGKNGRFDTPRRLGATDGEGGGFGEPGKTGISIDAYLNFEKINGQLLITVDGGRGGAGGPGGHGGSRRVICDKVVNLATNGGDSGRPGRGG